MVHALRRSHETQALLAALMFNDSKRPVTKKLLQQVDLLALLRAVDYNYLENPCEETARSVGREPSEWKPVYERLVEAWSREEHRLDLRLDV